MKDAIIKQAESEWTIDGESVRRAEKTEGIACDLCAKKPIQDICVIQNKITSMKMTVGSECVKHFDDYKKLDIAEIVKRSKEIARLEGLYKYFPNLQKTLQEYRVFLNSQPILIISSLTNKYDNALEQIDDLIKEYTAKNVNKKNRMADSGILKNIGTLLAELSAQKAKITDYVSENKGGKFIPTSSMVSKLKNNNSQGAMQALEWLREDGFIKHRTLPRISDIGLASNLIDDFNQYSREYNLRILDTDDRGGILYYRVQFLDKDYTFHLKFEDFANEYGSLLTGEEHLPSTESYKEIIVKSRLIDASSVENALYHYVDVAKKLRIPLSEGLSVNQVYPDFQDVAFQNRAEKLYLLQAFGGLVETFQGLLFVDDKILAERFVTQILLKSRKYTYDDYGELKHDRGYT